MARCVYESSYVSQPVWISVLSTHDLGQLARASFETPGEGFLSALVEHPDAVVARLIGADLEAWQATEAELVAQLAAATDDKARAAAKKRIPALVPARFRGDRRNIGECVERQIIGHDFDHVHALSFEHAVALVVAALPDRYLAIHTTPSERNPDGSWRLRVFELLDRAATPEEWESRVKPYMRSVGEHDAQALDVARLLYMPIRTAGYRFEVIPGPRTRLDALVPVEVVPVEAPTVPTPHVAPSARRAAAAQLLGASWPAKGRHLAQMALAGALRRDGWTPEDAFGFLCDVCKAAGDEDPDKRAQTIAATWETKAHVVGWSTLERHVDAGIVSAARSLVDRDADGRREFAEVLSQTSAAQAAQTAPLLPDTIAAAPPEPSDELEASLKLTWGAWDEEVEPIKYLVTPIIPAGTVGMIVAKGSSLKTWMLLSLAIAVANGLPWLGAYPVEQGKALIVDFEEGRHTLQRRAHLLGKLASPELGHMNFPRAQLDDIEFWKKLARIIHTRGIKVVCIDSFAAGTPGLDENDRRAADPLILAGRIAEELGVTIIILHHGKKGEGGDERDQVRGNGALYAGLDWCFTLVPQDEDRKRMLVRCVKPCGPRPADFRIALSETGLSLDSAVDHKAEYAAMEKRIIAELEKGPVETLHRLERALGVGSGKLTDEIKALELRGAIRVGKPFGYALDTDDARRTRILKAVEPGKLTSVARIATEARVDKDAVALAVANGDIAESYPDGPFIVVKRSTE